MIRTPETIPQLLYVVESSANYPVVAWTPLVLLDWSIVGVLLGMSTWYWQKNEGWRAGTLVGSVGVLLGYSIWVAVWMWQKMSNKGGLGEEESKAFKEVKQRMDDSR